MRWLIPIWLENRRSRPAADNKKKHFSYLERAVSLSVCFWREVIYVYIPGIYIYVLYTSGVGSINFKGRYSSFGSCVVYHLLEAAWYIGRAFFLFQDISETRIGIDGTT